MRDLEKKILLKNFNSSLNLLEKSKSSDEYEQKLVRKQKECIQCSVNLICSTITVKMFTTRTTFKSIIERILFSESANGKFEFLKPMEIMNRDGEEFANHWIDLDYIFKRFTQSERRNKLIFCFMNPKQEDIFDVLENEDVDIAITDEHRIIIIFFKDTTPEKMFPDGLEVDNLVFIPVKQPDRCHVQLDHEFSGNHTADIAVKNLKRILNVKD